MGNFFSNIIGGLTDLGGALGDGFAQGFKCVVSSGTTVGSTVADGAARTLKNVGGGFAYVVDFGKATPAQVGQWSSTAAGNVRDFSLEAYEEAKKDARAALDFILSQLQTDLPELGPYDPRARLVMTVLISSAGVSSWERDATAKGYTMAFDFGATANCAPVGGVAFAGIYVDKTGQWGFFAHAGAGSSLALTPNVTINIELWMVFGGRERFGQKCYMPGLSGSIPLPDGGAIKGGLNVLLTTGGDFLGFRVLTGFALIASDAPIAPDAGPSRSTVVGTTLSKRAPSQDAALRAARNPAGAASLVAAATRASLPFVANPGATYYIQNKGSGKFLDIPAANAGDVDIVQFTWTGAANQRFRFIDAGNNTFYIQPTHINYPPLFAGKVLDVRGASGSEGARIMQYQRNGGDNQKWQIQLARGGWYYLIARHSGMAMDVDHASTADLAAVLQYPWHGNDNQQFRFVEAIDQPKWAWCKRCSQLFHTGTKPGACPAGGAHDPSASAAYQLFVAPVGFDVVLVQDCWRWCSRCAGLSWGGGVGKCPANAGGPHDTALTANYVVRTAGVPVPYNQQDQWRWCTRCMALFHGGTPGVCAAGGAHTPGTTNYVLRL